MSTQQIVLPSGAGERLRLSASVLEALNNPIRREALRLIHQSGKGRSAIELAESINEPSTTVSWHMRKLVKVGALELERIRPFRGFEEKFFTSRVADNDLVLSILNETDEDDASIRSQGDPVAPGEFQG